MRRAPELALHLWGIVDGSTSPKGAVVLGAPEQFIISPGMAIDGYGREINDGAALRPVERRRPAQPHRRAAGLLAGDRVSQRIDDAAVARPPAVRLDDQFTRLHETFAVLILPEKRSRSGGVADSLSDDPINDPWPVILARCTDPQRRNRRRLAADRVYVGSRTERLVRADGVALAGRHRLQPPDPHRSARLRPEFA